MHRLWILALVPPLPGGRWLAGLLVLVASLSIFRAAGALDPGRDGEILWPAALFFCLILTYLTPVIHFVTERTEAAYDQLLANTALPAGEAGEERLGISAKRPLWFLGDTLLAVTLWLAQSWVLAGGFGPMLEAITSGSFRFVMAMGPLAVWLFMTTALHALVDNARLFRRLGARLHVDPLDAQALTPVGHMAVTSTLVVIGSQALFPVMWLGGATDPWTTIPGLLATTVALLFLFLTPVWPMHRALRRAKLDELARVQGEINALRASSELGRSAQIAALEPVLIYRRAVAMAPDWPFDLGVLTRLVLYLVIVPLTWIGAAFIEYLVDRFMVS